MTKVTHPDKERFKKYLEKRRREDEPPPTPEEIREILGWKLIKHPDQEKDRD